MIAERIQVSDHYAEHHAAMTAAWTEALEHEPFDAVLVHAGELQYPFLDDNPLPFRCNPHLQAWAPLSAEHDSALLFRPGQKPILWYYQPVDYWHVVPSDPDGWWADHFDLRCVTEADAWREALSTDNLAAIGDAPSLAAAFSGERLNPDRFINRLHLVRTRKTEYEIACLREANRVAATAHRAAEHAFRAGKSEYHIHLDYLAASQQTDNGLPYGNIIALNEHAAVLHYQHQSRRRVTTRSFLIDAGASQQGYASDITRTYAAEAGDFATLIELMEGLQRQLADAVAPGVDYRELHLDAHRAVAGALADAGVIRCAPEDAVSSGLTSVFYPHGLGHFIGLQTHDVAGLIADADGTPIPRPEGHPFLRLTRVLEPGNVVTIEPGLYFIDTLLADWRAGAHAGLVDWERVESLRPYGGIRIEDDVLVTEDGCENLTRSAFARVAAG